MQQAFGHVLVTGGAGFVGSQLVRRLLPIAKSVTVIDDLSTGARSALPESSRLTLVEGTYVDEALLKRTLPDIDVIFHLACRNLVMSAERMDDDFHVNLFGGYMLLKQAVACCTRLRRVVYTSTASVYGNAVRYPTTEEEYRTMLPYSASKLSMEHYCSVFYAMYQLPTTVLRLSNVYGPGQVTSNPYCGVVAKFMDAVDDGVPYIVYGDGTQTRDYTYIDDATEAIMLAARHPSAVGGVFNVGTSKETNVLQLADCIARKAKGGQHPVTFREKRTVDVVYRRCLDASKLTEATGWRPAITLERGIERTYLWRKAGGRTDAHISRQD